MQIRFKRLYVLPESRFRWNVAEAFGSVPELLMLDTEKIALSERYVRKYGSAEGPPRDVENRNLLSHPDELRVEAYVIRMTQ